MGLSCSCEWDGEGWYFYAPDDFSVFIGKRASRCCSCGGKIRPGDEAGKFIRERGPNNDIEERIHGYEVPLASWWMCERCAGLYFALDELGYCITLGDDMRDLAAEAGAIQVERMRVKINPASSQSPQPTSRSKT